mgnify:CR=1 FL=1
MMKEAVRRVVDELDGESIATHELQKMIAKHYTDTIKEYGTPSEKAHLIKLRNLSSVKPFVKLIREYGYESKGMGPLAGNTTLTGMGNKSPVMSTTIWEKTNVKKTWNALSKYPPVSEARNTTLDGKLKEKAAKGREKYRKMLRYLATHPLTPEGLKESTTLTHELYQLGEKILADRLKKKIERLNEGLRGRL